MRGSPAPKAGAERGAGGSSCGASLPKCRILKGGRPLTPGEEEAECYPPASAALTCIGD